MKKIPTLFKREFQDHHVINMRRDTVGELSAEADRDEPCGKEVW